MKKYDIIVVGGGLAGVAAAIAARREGASVLLVEKGNCLGGAAVHALVNPFMPITTKVDGVATTIYSGIFSTVCERLGERGAIKLGRTCRSFLEEELKQVLNNMTMEVGVDLLFHAYIFAAERSGDTVTSISVATRSGVLKLEADKFIDATGDAQLAYLADCPTVLGRESDNLCQPMTLCFRLGNVDVERFFASWEKLKAAHKEALDNGKLLNPRENILVFYTPLPNVLHFNTTRVVKLDPTSPEEFTRAEILARDQVFEVYELMKKHADGLENSFIMMTAAEIGVRESRKIVGDYVLTESDCRALTEFEDKISVCNYDIDIHNPEGTGTSHYYFPEGRWYTIPYRALIPKKADNMLVAGRCISSDHGAQASYRIMPSVSCIGEAAGTAMGLAVKSGCSVRDIDVKELQATLRRNGAFLGK